MFYQQDNLSSKEDIPLQLCLLAVYILTRNCKEFWISEFEKKFPVIINYHPTTHAVYSLWDEFGPRERRE